MPDSVRKSDYMGTQQGERFELKSTGLHGCRAGQQTIRCFNRYQFKLSECCDIPGWQTVSSNPYRFKLCDYVSNCATTCQNCATAGHQISGYRFTLQPQGGMSKELLSGIVFAPRGCLHRQKSRAVSMPSPPDNQRME